jgi:ABC-type Fe3+/spermidine/putrescine transport system ATPase subunit
VTHDQQEALSIADRIAILDAGKILQTGTPAEIYRNPRSRIVAEFIGEANMLNARITGRNEFVDLDVDGIHLRAANSSDIDCKKIGSTIRICVRPEAIQIVDRKSLEQSWMAKLTETVYLGPIAQHRFACGKIILKVTEANPRPAQFHIGSDYFLSVVPDDVILLPEHV